MRYLLLIFRLKGAELEKNRAKVRIAALKDKSDEVDILLSHAKQEIEQLKTNEEKIETYKAAGARKDSMIKNLKEQNETHAAESSAKKELLDSGCSSSHKGRIIGVKLKMFDK